MTGHPDAAEALYTYAIVAAGTLAPAVPGLLPGSSVEVIAEGPVAALVSRVPRAPFLTRAQDTAWVADLAARHLGVCAALGAPCLPLACGVMFTTAAPLRDWLRARGTVLAAALERGAPGPVGDPAALQPDVVAAGGRTLQSLARLEKAQEAVRLARRAATIARLAALLDGHARARIQSHPLGPVQTALVPAAEAARLRAALDAQAAELAASGVGQPLGIPGIGTAWPAPVFAKPAVNDTP
ncbi:gas vesicle protein GvpL/GvpF [Humitalea rosea]|uniref:Gas vesicle protein GvpL/GvpF n=1 Tax=Humitalea rosea TaxID=990373 RepID=A0A2W7IMW2_9PROT|nr:GvpL/GvpF family gas vesicle protein [Humitalea rosea]PZW48293.1 gas vesicle protein GvpL/GvpF [Humitalea rosea]